MNLIEKNTIIDIETSILNVVKKISKEGVLFYILDLSSETNKTQACLCPQYFEHDVEKMDLKKLDTCSCIMKIKSVFKKDSNEVFYYILDIQKKKNDD